MPYNYEPHSYDFQLMILDMIFTFNVKKDTPVALCFETKGAIVNIIKYIKQCLFGFDYGRKSELEFVFI